MLRVRDLDAALDFFCTKLGLVELRRSPDEKGRYTNVFLAAPQNRGVVDDGKHGGRAATSRILEGGRVLRGFVEPWWRIGCGFG
jgi:catechol 2,3-dioxygenase-like lactoylglutathione lyase family enzyme